MNHISLDQVGNRVVNVVNADKYELNLDEQYECEFKYDSDKGRGRLKIYDDVEQSMYPTITASIQDDSGTHFGTLERIIELLYKPRDLSKYSFNGDQYITLDSTGSTIGHEDMAAVVAVDYRGTPLSSDCYDIELLYPNIEPPYGLDNKGKKTGRTDYRIKAVAKKGSGFYGETGIGFVTFWKSNSIHSNSVDFKFDQDQISWSYHDKHHKNVQYSEPFAWISAYIDEERDIIPYGRYAQGAFDEDPVLKLINRSSLTLGEDYIITYYNRKTFDEIDVKSLGSPLDSFPTNPGCYLAKASGVAPYEGDAYYAFDITEPINKATVTGITSKRYTGKKITQAPVVKLNGKTLKEGSDYVLSYKNNVNPGKATVAVVGTEKYRGSIEKTFVIDKALINKATITGITTKRYNGKKITQTPVVKMNGKTLKKGADYVLSYKNNVNPGRATVTVTGTEKYTGSIAKTFVINKGINTLQVKTKTLTVRQSTLKKRSCQFAASKALKVIKPQGKVTYTKLSKNKVILMNKAGKITVKKNTKKGRYRIKVRVTAAGNTKYLKGQKTVTYVVNVK